MNSFQSKNSRPLTIRVIYVQDLNPYFAGHPKSMKVIVRFRLVTNVSTSLCALYRVFLSILHLLHVSVRFQISFVSKHPFFFSFFWTVNLHRNLSKSCNRLWINECEFIRTILDKFHFHWCCWNWAARIMFELSIFSNGLRNFAGNYGNKYEMTIKFIISNRHSFRY